jgi:hypothetical protein
MADVRRSAPVVSSMAVSPSLMMAEHGWQLSFCFVPNQSAALGVAMVE